MNPFPNEDSDLEEALASAFVDLKSFSANEEGYQETVDQIAKLYKLKTDRAKIILEAEQASSKHELELKKSELENEKHSLAIDQFDLEKQKFDLEEIKFNSQVEHDARPFYTRVDPNVVATVLGNLLIGLAVIKYEQTGVISTKVMSFMKKI